MVDLIELGIWPTEELLAKITICAMYPDDDARQAMLRRHGWHQDPQLDEALVLLGLRSQSPGAYD